MSQSIPTDIYVGKNESGTLLAGETNLFRTEVVQEEEDLEIRLVVDSGDADLYVLSEGVSHPPSDSFYTWKGDYGSGDEVVFISSKHNDFKMGRYVIAVVGFSVESKWTLDVAIYNETRAIIPEEQEVIDRVRDTCCKEITSCGKWKMAVEDQLDFCYLKGNFCSKDGHLEIMDIQSDGIDCSFPSEFEKFSALHTLQLKSNSIKADVSDLVFSVQKMLSLRRLMIANNEISGELDCKLFENGLRSIDLSSNDIRGQIPSCISQDETLQELYLPSNSIEGILPPLPVNLQVLAVSENYLSGPFPDIFRGAERLGFVSISRNRIEGSIPRNAFPPSLQHLFISNNLLNGEIPADLFELPNLLIFDGSYNRFSGELPASSFLGKLTMLNVRNNRLEGLPQSYSAEDLQYVDITSNCMTGQHPEGLSRLPRLQQLHMGQNAFQGDLYALFSNLDTIPLQMLNISLNGFTGMLPAEADRIVMKSNASAQHMLDASFNLLSGTLPPFLNNNELVTSAAQGFLTLRLDHNFFLCPLPEGLGWIQNLVCTDTSDVGTATESELLSRIPQCSSSVEQSNGLSAGQIAGIVIGVTASCVILGGLIFLTWKHYKTHNKAYLHDLETHIEMHSDTSKS